MLLGGVQQYTMIDYPGKLACVVFTMWCNFRCPFCHNPESVLPELIQQQRHNMIDEEAFFGFLRERQGKLDAVSICWGEPTLHPDLPAFARRIKSLGYLVKLDTNGRDAQMIEEMLGDEVLDYVAVDMKHTPDQYAQATGGELSMDFRWNFESLLDILKEWTIEYEYRTTVVKWMHSEDDIQAMAQYLEGISNYYLQTYKAGNTLDPNFQGIAYNPLEMIELQKIAAKYVRNCEVRE